MTVRNLLCGLGLCLALNAAFASGGASRGDAVVFDRDFRTEEGDPSLDTLCRRLLAEGVGRVRLMPLMLVAGDHAVNDMASEASGSWKSRLQAQGIEARCILRGLGSWEFIQKLYAAHALEAASSREGLDIPGKDDKLR